MRKIGLDPRHPVDHRFGAALAARLRCGRASPAATSGTPVRCIAPDFGVSG